jgi:hypothetical protein
MLIGQTPHLGNAPSYLELTVRPIRLLGREDYNKERLFMLCA